MGGKTYKSILYHISCHTKDSQPFINEKVEKEVYHFMWNKSKRLGLYLHRIGGIEDHVHLLIYIPPKNAVVDIVGKLKGSSSYYPG